MKLAILAALGAGAFGTELTSENWDKKTAGQTVFVKFYAPWCGHCKTMKPDWDKLMDEFDSSKTAGIYEVDCTASGQSLCETMGVKGYPTLKWGDPSDLLALKDYEGGRTYDDFKKFAETSLGPTCSLAALDLCDADTKAIIEGFMARPRAELEKQVVEVEKSNSQLEKAYSKKLSKFNSDNHDFLTERAEEKEQLDIYKREKEEFEKKRAKASKKDIEKQNKKDKKAKDRTALFEKRQSDMEAQKEIVDNHKKDLDEKVKKAGLKYLKLVLSGKPRTEL